MLSFDKFASLQIDQTFSFIPHSQEVWGDDGFWPPVHPRNNQTQFGRKLCPKILCSLLYVTYRKMNQIFNKIEIHFKTVFGSCSLTLFGNLCLDLKFSCSLFFVKEISLFILPQWLKKLNLKWMFYCCIANVTDILVYKEVL